MAQQRKEAVALRLLGTRAGVGDDEREIKALEIMIRGLLAFRHSRVRRIKSI
jgi:hypothetical protein